MKQRDSNLECLRIIAIFLVLIVHATFIGTGFPHINEVIQHPLNSFFRFGFGSLSIVCVNLFVLITGWFGIRFNVKKLISLFLIALFYSLFIYIILLSISPSKYWNRLSVSTILMLNSSDYWFVKSYIILYIFSPILNTFIDTCSKKQFELTIFLFYACQTIYGWLSIYGAADFQGGYSALSFIGLYLLAQYFHRYPGITSNWKAKMGIGIYLGISLFNTIIAFVLTQLGLPIAGRIFTYTNPLVIIQSLALLIGFSKFSFHNKFINWMASSCLAVYLTHANELVLRIYFGPTIKNWYKQESPILFLLYTLLFISCIFALSILIDKVRMQLFKLLKIC